MEENVLIESDDNIFDENFEEQVLMDAMFEEELLNYREAKIKAERYIKTCKAVINNYETKISMAKERIDSMEERTKLMMYSMIKQKITRGIIGRESIKENDKCYMYSIPSAKFLIIKPEPIIENEEKLGKWMLENQFFTDHDGAIDLKKLREVCEIVNDEVVFKETGEIIDGMGISEERLEIKLIKGGK